MTTPPRTALGRLSPQRRRFWLAIVAIVLSVVLVPVAVMAIDSEPASVVAQDDRGPMLLVPGFGGSTASLRVLAERLRDDGRDVRIVGSLGDGTGDLRDEAKNLADEVAAVLQSTGAASVDLLGYSAGGVVVRWYLAELGGTGQVRRVVTLASPHHGTDVAALAVSVAGGSCPVACQQLAPDSDLLFTLNQDETPAGPVYVAIRTQFDRTVVPSESGTLDGALSYAVQDVCPDLRTGHGDMPLDPTVQSMVILALQEAAPTLPEASICAASS